MAFFPQWGEYYLSFGIKARKNVFLGMEFNSYIFVKEPFCNPSVMGGDPMPRIGVVSPEKTRGFAPRRT
jgi:hypothetical protein